MNVNQNITALKTGGSYTSGWFPSPASASFARFDLDGTAIDEAFGLGFDFPFVRIHDGQCIFERYTNR